MVGRAWGGGGGARQGWVKLEVTLESVSLWPGRRKGDLTRRQTWSVIFFFLVSCDILPRRPPLADAPVVSWGRGRRPGGYDPHAGSVRSSLRTLLRLQNRSCFTPPSCVGCPILPSGERKEYLPLFWRLLSLRLLRNALSRPSK